MGELDQGSQAILNYVNMDPGDIELFRLINHLAYGPMTTHTPSWYFRRLVALALEGRIEATVNRDGDNMTIKFRRLPGALEKLEAE